MDVKQASLSLDSIVSSFNARIAELQDLVVARNMYPASSVTDLSAVDATLKALELQLQQIKDRLREETLAIPKAKKLIQASLQQQKKLQNMSAYVPSYLPQPEREEVAECSVIDEPSRQDHSFGIHDPKEEPLPLPKEKKGRGSPPVWYITADELDSLSSYMRGRLTLDKINAAINDMAAYAEANSQLMTAPRKKLTESTLEKALEIRDIGATEGVKGKHFFLETDVKGPTLKLDNTGKAIFTVLRHLGRLSESRIKNHRVFVLLRPH
ncbi:putative spindle and kinetochore-associated protein [Helianthus annuus]|uniref:SKA complex subunit 1 homolog n=1 Tax=Helianthus annuus TaxID=4232 RepID=A0A9K3DSQ7_HELAN|nr:spindle and kinetochore-associated protein 1 homolog [Helianthus annuus]KAF5761010.1 putative spindle and kinetochore-associated protein [Helianthus annuus]KAJ0822132.1 putative spindle and kinetochore-associated protein [Helianthus annuus]